MIAPRIERHAGVDVVRDDLLPGGTKARYLAQLFDVHDEVVYATPVYGGAQLALAYAARERGKRVTLFCAKRAQLHPRTLEAIAAGAHVSFVNPGYLARCQGAAREYAARTGAHYLAFGGDSEQAIAAIADAAAGVISARGDRHYDEIWCAAGSGTLVRGIQRGMMAVDPYWRATRLVAVQVGRGLAPAEVGDAAIVEAPLPYERALRLRTPFPSCPHYDAKAWMMCLGAAARRPSSARVLFWNVLGPSPTPHAEGVR